MLYTEEPPPAGSFAVDLPSHNFRECPTRQSKTQSEDHYAKYLRGGP